MIYTVTIEVKTVKRHVLKMPFGGLTAISIAQGYPRVSEAFFNKCNSIIMNMEGLYIVSVNINITKWLEITILKIYINNSYY